MASRKTDNKLHDQATARGQFRIAAGQMQVSAYNQKVFQLVVENVEDYAVFVVDLDGRVVSWNPGVEKLLGFKEDEFIGVKGSVIFTPEDRAARVPEWELETALKTGKCEDVRWHLRRDGSRFWANGLMMLLKDEAGEIKGFVKIMRDHTPAKIADERLRESEEKFRSLFDSLDDGFCIIEMIFDETGKPVDYRHLEINHTFEQQTGLVGARSRTMRELVPGIEKKWAEIYGKVALTGEAARFENFSAAMDRWFEVYAFRFGRAENNQVAVVFRDITLRKQAEAERERLLKQIETERRRFAYLFEQAPSLVAVLHGPNHVFELANPAYLQLMNNRDVLGKPIREALPEIEGQGFFELLDEVYKTGEPFIGRDLPIWLQRDPNTALEERFFDFVYQPIFDHDGRVSGIFAHGVDITEQVEARRHAEAANRLKDDFLATVSHELRTPLNAILGWAKMLQSGALDEKSREKAVQTIVRSSESQAQLIEDLLDVSRIISGKLRLNLEAVEIVQLVEAAIETVLPAAEAKSISLQTLIGASVPAMTGDPERLQQIFWNLLTNAVKFTPKNGTIRVRLEQVGSSLEFSVEDTGIGIKEEFLPHVFDRFRQADAATTRAAGGMGLGLAIVRSLVEMHGGTIQAASAGEGKGATFTAAFPVRVLDEPAITKKAPPARASESDRGRLAFAATLDGLKIVFVDDKEDARFLVHELLSLSGAEVTLCASAAEALEKVPAVLPDLIISDIGMPDEDGYSLIRRVRALSAEQGGQTPAIALTAYTRAEDRVKALTAGYQMFIPKPIDPAELVAAAASLAALGRKSD